MNVEQCILQLHNVLVFFPLSINQLFKYKHVYVNIIFFFMLWVWHFVCHFKERHSAGFGNSADQSLEFMAESNRKLEKTA
jgi:hypothetical protein